MFFTHRYTLFQVSRTIDRHGLDLVATEVFTGGSTALMLETAFQAQLACHEPLEDTLVHLTHQGSGDLWKFAVVGIANDK